VYNLFEEMLAVVDDLEANQIDYALCGGLAVAIHGFSRATKDIDLLIRREDLERILVVVRSRGFNLEAGILPMGAGEATPLDIFRISKVDGKNLLTLDLLIVNMPLQPAWDAREYLEVQGTKLQVVSPAGLYIMKKLSGRPQDIVDLQRLGLWPDDPTP
jgi:hypothetical protein